MSIERKGAGNPAWKGGRSMLPYPYTWTAEFKKRILDAQGRFCHVCWEQVNSRGYEMDVHHIDGEKRNMHDSNFIVLCHSCHQKITMEKWEMGVFDGETGVIRHMTKDPDWRQKISKALKGKPKSPEHRAKLQANAIAKRKYASSAEKSKHHRELRKQRISGVTL